MNSDTIFALSSGVGTGGVAVIRMSGSKAMSVLDMIATRSTPKPRVAYVRDLFDPMSGEKLDQSLVIYFKGPQSFTGEDIVEYHVHGGRAVIDGVLSCFGHMEGVRLAEPGEFSRRAFENGKLDLTEIEGLSDLISAQTAAQKGQALRQMDGALSLRYEKWRKKILKLLAIVEAEIDFPDEDLPDGIGKMILPDLHALKSEMENDLQDYKRGIRLREGLKLVILGAPNAGKSTLLNAMAKSDVAIVSEEEGTTRDIIEVQMDIGGFPVIVSDTAGVREGDIGDIEREGIRRATERGTEADIQLILLRADRPAELPEALKNVADKRTIFLVSQVDRVHTGGEMFHVEQFLSHADIPKDIPVIPISAKAGIGLDGLFSTLHSYADRLMGSRESPAITRLRHKEALDACVLNLTQAEENLDLDLVLAAEDIRMATRAVGRITGRVDVEDMLDSLFLEFCIGK